MKKALLTIGGEHHPFESCGRILTDALQQKGACEVTTTEALDVFADLTGYDLVIIFTYNRTMSAEQEAGLVDFVGSGGGLIGIHCVCDSFHTNHRFLETLGCHFATHAPFGEFDVTIVDHEHDVTRGCSDFRVDDELYVLEMKGPPVHVLATTTWQSKTQPMAYVKTHGQGRVVYVAPGHDESTFNHPEFQKMILNAVGWVTRQF